MFGLSRKRIVFEVALGKGDYGNKNNTCFLQDRACKVSITKKGVPGRDSATISIWGLSEQTLASFIKQSYVPGESQNNVINIMAGEEYGPLTLAFTGEIISAVANFSAVPDVRLDISAATGYYANAKKMADTSINGIVQVPMLMEQLTLEAGMVYNNDAFSASLKNPVLKGSPWQKIQQLALQSGADLFLENNIVTTTPKGKMRNQTPHLLSPETGMVGYPSFQDHALAVDSFFQPTLVLGGPILVQSSLPKACGLWRTTSIVHSLCAHNAPENAWHSHLLIAKAVV